MDLRYDPDKLRFGADGHVFYDEVDVAADLQTFLDDAHKIFPLPTSTIIQASQTTRPTVAASRHDPLNHYQPRPDSSSSDSDQRKSSSDSEKSTTFAPALGGVSDTTLDLTSPLAKTLDVATKTLAGTDLHRIPAKKSVQVKETPGKLIADRKFSSDMFFGAVASSESDMRSLSHITGKRKYIGISPEEIVASGSLQCLPCRPSNLDGLLLKVFRFENFNDTPADVYSILQPALILATRFMTDRRLLPFWATLAVGEREFDESLESGDERSLAERLPRRVSLNPQVESNAWWRLERLGDHIHFSWNDLETSEIGTFTFGRKLTPEHDLWLPQCNGTNNLNLGFWQSSRSTDPWEQESILQLSRDFYTTAKRIARLQNPDVAMVLRFHFFFAVNICHEVAHAFERKCGLEWFHTMLREGEVIDLSNPHWPNLPTQRVQEAAWLQDSVVEMGVAWERDTFGGRIMPVNFRIDASLGIMVGEGESDWGINFDTMNAGQPQAYMIPMAFIEEIQQQSFWDRPSHPTEPHKLLHIPRSGAVTNAMVATSPAGWRSWLKQRDTGRKESQASISGASDADDDSAGPSKRIRLNPDPSQRPKKPLPARGALLRPRARLQARIDKAISKQEQNLEEMRKEAMATLAEEKAATAAAEEARQSQQYVPPPPNQTDLHDQLHYDGSDSDARRSSCDSDPDADPALKPPHKLTVEDKWLLCEEYLLISPNPSIESSSQFLAMRSVDDTTCIPFYLDPCSSKSWTQGHLDMLLDLRKHSPRGALFQEQQKQKRVKEIERRRLMVIWQEMEELAVRAGLSRIEFHKAKAAGGPLPLDMRVDTWEQDPKWRELLHGMRETDKFMETPKYQKLLQTGAALPSAQGASAVLARLRSWKPPNSESQEEESRVQRNKITEYFPPSKEKDQGKGKEQAVDHDSDKADGDWKPVIHQGNSSSSVSDSDHRAAGDSDTLSPH